MSVLIEEKPREQLSVKDAETITSVGHSALTSLEESEINPDSVNDHDTYAEIYADTPAKALLWEARKIAETVHGIDKDAMLIELVEAYSIIDPGEALELIEQIKNKYAKMEALAKFGYGARDDLAISRARKIAGRNLDNLIVVGRHGHDEETLAKVFKRVRGKPWEIEHLVDMAAGGYAQAMTELKRIALEYRDEEYIPYITKKFHMAMVPRIIATIRLLDKKHPNLAINGVIDDQWRKYCSAHAETTEKTLETESSTLMGRIVENSYHVAYGHNNSPWAFDIPGYFTGLVSHYKSIRSPKKLEDLLDKIVYDKSDMQNERLKNMGVIFTRDLRLYALMRAVKENALVLNSEK